MDDAISRRDFTLRAVLTLFSGVAITITGCGDDDGSSDDGSPSPAPTPSTNPGPSTGDVSGVISANHGHTAVISAAQLRPAMPCGWTSPAVPTTRIPWT